jgi:fatty-acyl-CoA synthase/long-chain acyl-CoA synthetase
VTTYTGAALASRARPSDLLRVGLDTDPDGWALVSAEARLTWQELDELSSRLAAMAESAHEPPG